MIAGGKPTPAQVQLAKNLGLSLRRDTARIAAARLRTAVAPALVDPGSQRDTTEAQEQLGRKLGIKRPSPVLQVAASQIALEIEIRNARAMGPVPLRTGHAGPLHRIAQRSPTSAPGWSSV